MRAGLLLDVALMYSDWPLIDNGHGILLAAPAWAFWPLISVCAPRRNRMKKVWLHSVYRNLQVRTQTPEARTVPLPLFVQMHPRPRPKTKNRTQL